MQLPFTLKSLLVIMLLASVNSFSQVGIGTVNPDPSSIVDVSSSTKGFLIPRMTRLQRDNIVNPEAGLMVYCTNCCPGGIISFFNSKIWKNTVDCSDNVSIENDFDGDGIPNGVDIDDDNDGILDILECPIEYADFSGLNLTTGISFNALEVTQAIGGNPLPTTITVNPPVAQTPNTNGETKVGAANNGFSNNAVIRLQNNGAKPGEIFTNQFDFSTPNRIEILASSAQVNSNITSIDEFTFEPINPPSNFTWNFVSGPNSVITTSVNQITIKNPSVSTSGNFAEFNIESNVKIEGFVVTYKTLGTTSANSGQFLFSLGCSDNDGDGYPNYLDLDSDNDGCSDAFESGMTTNTQTYYNFPEPHGTNGLANILENSLNSGVTLINPNVSLTLDGVCAP